MSRKPLVSDEVFLTDYQTVVEGVLGKNWLKLVLAGESLGNAEDQLEKKYAKLLSKGVFAKYRAGARLFFLDGIPFTVGRMYSRKEIDQALDIVADGGMQIAEACKSIRKGKYQYGNRYRDYQDQWQAAHPGRSHHKK